MIVFNIFKLQLDKLLPKYSFIHATYFFCVNIISIPNIQKKIYVKMNQ